jgi:hypothetical protein
MLRINEIEVNKMILKIVLNGVLQSCCSMYPPEFVHEIVSQWTNGICNVNVIDAKKGDWKPDKLASMAIKYFGEQAYPFIYLNNVLISLGHLPSREELFELVSQEEKEGVSEKVIEASQHVVNYRLCCGGYAGLSF